MSQNPIWDNPKKNDLEYRPNPNLKKMKDLVFLVFLRGYA